MNRITLDDEVLQPEIAWETWGDLLEVVDRRCAAAGTVVTAVRFDGVEQPAFRQVETLQYPLADLAAVEAQTASPTALLLSTIEEACQASTRLAGAAERIGAGFRGFDISTANDDLVEFAQGLGTMVTLANVLAQAIGVDLQAVACDGMTGAEMIGELSTHAGTLVGAQEIGDWITVADVVEYDLVPALGRWPDLFAELRTAVDRLPAPAARA